MNLISKVIFSYDIRAGHFGQSSSFESIDELKQVVQEAEYQKPYNLSVKRTIQIIDTDVKVRDEPKMAFNVGQEFKNPPVICEIPAESVVFCVADKLLYPRDVHKILVEKYGRTFNFDETKMDADKPVKFGMSDSNVFGLNPVQKATTQYTLHHVHCSPLTQKDIVVNDKLEQIWPEKTKTAPKSLNEILAKTKEEIKQR